VERETARNFPNRFGLLLRSYLNDANRPIFCGRLGGSARLYAVVLVVRPMSSSVPGA
jgi:hypothetical protein